MRDLSDVRKLLARGNTEALPVHPDLAAEDNEQ
jgi:hypothetical protein